MTVVLVVYEEVPERTLAFSVPMTDEEFNKFRQLSGVFGNTVECSDLKLDKLADEMYEKLFTGNVTRELGPWADYEIDLANLPDMERVFDRVILTGFIL
jgi:hypothetical protein